jgi:hypothetical protein
MAMRLMLTYTRTPSSRFDGAKPYQTNKAKGQPGAPMYLKKDAAANDREERPCDLHGRHDDRRRKQTQALVEVHDPKHLIGKKRKAVTRYPIE